jgi:hypothetical protein
MMIEMCNTQEQPTIARTLSDEFTFREGLIKHEFRKFILSI